MLINASIEELIKTENINSQKESKEYAVNHSLLIRESFVIGLDNLKDKYNISIYKLIYMAKMN